MKLRQPAALVVLSVLAVRVLIALGTAVVYLRSDFDGGLANLAAVISYRAGDPVLVALLAALVALCVLSGPTPRARELASAALVVVGVSLVVALVFTVIALVGLGQVDGIRVVNTLDQLLELTVPVLALVALVRLRPLAPARSTGDPYAVAAAETPIIAPPPAPTPVDEQYQPSWLPDTAAGAAWQRAGDAAAGAPASGWGTPGQGGGWQVDPGPATGPAPSGPERLDQGGGWNIQPPAPGDDGRPRS